MKFHSQFGGTFMLTEGHTRQLEGVLVIAGGIVVATFILMPQAGLWVAIGFIALWFSRLIVSGLCGRLDGLLLWWAAVFPLGYYFASFPREQAIVTLDRGVVAVASLGLLVAKSDTAARVPGSLRQAGFAWLAFAAMASLTLGASINPLNGMRALLDSAVLPFLLGWCVIARLDIRRCLPGMHTAVCISSMICAGIAAAEIITAQDLLPIGTAAASYEGIIRPNGPFESNDNLALIGAVSLFFLLFLRSVLGPHLSAARRALHFAGLAAAIGMALMPLFRSVAITLVVALIIDTFWEHGASRRAWRVALIAASVGLICMIAVLAPEVFEDRSSSGNVYGRVAELEQSLRVFSEHPLLGVGFLNFHNYVVGESRFVATYNGVSSLDWPHDNLAQVLTETGILGFIPYVLSQVLLVWSMWKLRRLNYSGVLAWKYLLYLFLTYWITGLSESSGYGSLNLWFMFVVGVIYKYVLSEPEAALPEEDEISREAFSAQGAAPLPAFLQ
jgi:O-antigen ligase